MTLTKILLLDAGLATANEDLLQNILRASCPRVELRRTTTAILLASCGAGTPQEARLLPQPDVLVAVVRGDSLAHARELPAAARAFAPDAALIAVAEGCGTDELLELLGLGFDDFITPPLRAVDIVPRVCRLLKVQGEDHALTRSLKEKLGLRQLVGETRVFLEEVRKIPLVARCDANVIISGETGTGKELCARAVHYLSRRAGGPFVPVNCGAIPVELVENELFGHERGAYTGASSVEAGLIREADGGTLFLDEVDCLPLSAQVKLLRFLQEKEYRPLGSSRTRKADERIVVATNLDLAAAVKAGRLRQDLYYRLNVMPLHMPPLRERREDIPLLARHFLSKYAAEFERPARDFSPGALHDLVMYDWPGNVRELQHVIERALVLCERRVVGSRDLALPSDGDAAEDMAGSFKEMKARLVERFEKNYILRALLACDGNITQAARLAHKNRRAFWQLLRKYAIDAQSFKPNS